MSFVHFMRSPAGRMIRIAMGAGIIAYGVQLDGAPRTVAILVGLLPIAAGTLNFCTIGPVFGADMWGRPRVRRS